MDAALLFVGVGAENMDSALDINDWVVEPGAAESKVIVDDEGEEGTKSLAEDWVVEDGAPDGRTLPDDWGLELAAPEAKEFVEAEETGR